MKIYKIAKLLKEASLTLSPEGLIQEDFTLLNLSNNIPFKVNKRIKEEWGTNDFFFTYDDITPDGDSVFETKGIMNVYLHKQDPNRIDEVVGYVIDAIKADERVGEVQYLRTELYSDSKNFSDSMMQERGIDPKMPRVARIKVVMDESKQEKRIPEVNMSNNNAFYIFREVLGYTEDFWEDPVLDARNLMSRIDYYLGETSYPDNSDQEMPELNRMFDGEEISEEEANSLRSFLSGRDAIRMYDDPTIKDRLNRIKKVCEWSLNKGIDKVVLT